MDTATLTVYSVIIFDIVYKSMYPKMFVDYSSREKNSANEHNTSFDENNRQLVS